VNARARPPGLGAIPLIMFGYRELHRADLQRLHRGEPDVTARHVLSGRCGGGSRFLGALLGLGDARRHTTLKVGDDLGRRVTVERGVC
jgi:hypothetical protein